VATADRAAVGVIGAGVKTPAGESLDELWKNLLGGRAGMSLYRHPELAGREPVVVGEVSGYDPGRYVTVPEARRLGRVHLLAIGAADDALSACPQRPPPHRCAVVCGIGYGAADIVEKTNRTLAATGTRGLSPLAIPLSMINSVAAHLAMRYGFTGRCLTVSSACASGADAIGYGAELVRHGEADLVLAGGADALLARVAFESFLRTGALSRTADPALACRPFDRDRDGFVLAEGAGFVVLKRLRRGGDDGVLGRIAGYAANCDAHHIVAPRDDGLMAARCAEAALADARVAPSLIGHVNAHGTSTVLNDRAEARALTTLFSGDPPPATAVKSVTGHMIGGSGAVEAIVTLLSLRDSMVPPVAGLRQPDPDLGLDLVVGAPRAVGGQYAISNSFGFGGHNTVLVLAAP
jgi:3-oxoacyl-[acyl-carrier-protein] synthase II